jgi:hypothetical protein
MSLYSALVLIAALILGAMWLGLIFFEIPPVAALPLYALTMACVIALAVGVNRIGRKRRNA